MARRAKANPQFREALRKALRKAVDKALAQDHKNVEEIAKRLGDRSKGSLYQFLAEGKHHVPRSDYLFMAMKELNFSFDFNGYTMRLEPKNAARRKSAESKQIQLELFCNTPPIVVEVPTDQKRPTVRVLVQFTGAQAAG